MLVVGGVVLIILFYFRICLKFFTVKKLSTLIFLSTPETSLKYFFPENVLDAKR